jgi:hypothetical protein
MLSIRVSVPFALTENIGGLSAEPSRLWVWYGVAKALVMNETRQFIPTLSGRDTQFI